MYKRNKNRVILVLVLVFVLVLVSTTVFLVNVNEKFGSVESKKKRLGVLRREINSRENPEINPKYKPRSTSLLFPFREDWFFTL